MNDHESNWRPAPDRDCVVGMNFYASRGDGTGGVIKRKHDDFRVTELSTVDPEPLTADEDDYPHLLVRARLRGWDTHDFVDRLSGELGISRRRVSWAGTKDKHAVTDQLFSIRSVDPESLPSVSRAELSPVGRLGRSLTFGDLAGNRFDIRVRDATTPTNHERITRELRQLGDGRVTVPNYFGHQRFGSMRPITHEVGLAILRRDWEDAVMTYLASTHPDEPCDTRTFRSYVGETRDWQAALDRCPGGLGFERTLLHGLIEGDYRDALDRLPQTLQGLFVNAAQSYLFNQIISERIERGLSIVEAVAGDVVCFTERHPELGSVPAIDRTQRVTEARRRTIERHVARGRACVTAPLVGSETTFAAGEPGDIERTVLQWASVDRAQFDLPEPYASRGTRRAIHVNTDLSIDQTPFRLRFGLPSGSYATVVLREYLKPDGPLG